MIRKQISTSKVHLTDYNVKQQKSDVSMLIQVWRFVQTFWTFFDESDR